MSNKNTQAKTAVAEKMIESMTSTKQCYVCQESKKLDLFARANNSKGGDGFAAYCLKCSAKLTAREKNAIVTRLWRRNNKEAWDKQHKDRSLRKTYGITFEQFQEMLTAQKGVCAICGEAPTTMNKLDTRMRALCVDHNHKTGKVRELLCVSCNSVVGHAENNPVRLELVAQYLKKHKR